MKAKSFLLPMTVLAGCITFGSPISLGLPDASIGLPKDRPVDTALFLGSGRKPVSSKVSATLTWRDDALEIRLRRQLDEGEVPKAVGTHDCPSSMFGTGSDTLEVFLAPHADDPGTLYQFAVNPSNVFYQARGFDTTWRPLKPVVTRPYFTPHEWGVDFRIPFGAFGEKPVTEGTVWRANFSGKRSNWSGISFYHNPFEYGTIVFGGRFPRVDPKPFLGKPKDATVLELDCFYYPVGTDPEREVRAKFPQAAVSVSRLSQTEFVVTVRQDGKSSVSQIELLDEKAEWPEGRHYMVSGSVNIGSRFQLGGILRSLGYVQKPVSGYLYDSSFPYFGATNVLNRRKSGLMTLNRFAYEAQLGVMTRAGKDAPIRVEPSSAAFYQARYRELKALYPNHTFSLHIDATPSIAEFAKACDVFDVTVPGSSYAVDPLPRLRGAFDYIRYYVGDKPVVYWLGGALPNRGAHRTADELNSAVRYSILRGAFGNMVHLGHGGIPESRTRLWNFLRGVERATNVWYSDWARGDPVDLSVATDAAVAAGARKTDEKVLLLAVNLSSDEKSLSYTDPAAGTRETVLIPGYGSVLRKMISK